MSAVETEPTIPNRMAWEWVFRVGMVVIGGFISMQQLTIQNNQDSIEINQQAIQANTVEIEKINASRYTPADALNKERSDNARWERNSDLLANIESNVNLILRLLQEEKERKEP